MCKSYATLLWHFAFIKKYTKESDGKCGGERGHAEKVMSQTAMNFKICIFVQRDPPLLSLISHSPTLQILFSQKVQPMKSSPQAVSFIKHAIKQIKLIIYLHILNGIIIFLTTSKRHTSFLSSLLNFTAMVTLVEFH